MLVDGVDQHLAAARENLRFGATQIKIMGGGGVMSDYDPIHSLQPSPEEIRAAVQAASDWGTYVLAHAYTSEAVRRLVDNGVRCIEHGLLIDDATAKYVKQNDVVISTQLVVYRALAEWPGLSDTNRRKLDIVLKGQENLIALIRKHKIRTGFATDLVGGMYPMMTREFTERAQYWTPHEVLVQATSESAAVIRMAGKLNRHGNFGEIREGWVADLLIHNGNPLDDISVLRDPANNLALIMLKARSCNRHRSRENSSVAHFAADHPLCAIVAEFLIEAALVRFIVSRAQSVAPAAVFAFVNERLGAAVPEGTAERHRFCGVFLHPVEAAVQQDVVPFAFVDRDIQEGR